MNANRVGKFSVSVILWFFAKLQNIQKSKSLKIFFIRLLIVYI